jgi:transcriptional regulator with XRE-family HTH domain
LASFLSQLERGLAAPSVATLLRLAEVLGVSIGDLFPPPTSSRVVHAEDRRTLHFQGPSTARSRNCCSF